MTKNQQSTPARPASIDLDIKKLREEEIIKRIGPDKGGYWQVRYPLPV